MKNPTKIPVGTGIVLALMVALAAPASGGTGRLSNGDLIPLDRAGYVIVGLFIVAWVGALAIWRYGHIEEKWSRSAGSPGR